MQIKRLKISILTWRGNEGGNDEGRKAERRRERWSDQMCVPIYKWCACVEKSQVCVLWIIIACTYTHALL